MKCKFCENQATGEMSFKNILADPTPICRECYDKYKKLPKMTVERRGEILESLCRKHYQAEWYRQKKIIGNIYEHPELLESK